MKNRTLLTRAMRPLFLGAFISLVGLSFAADRIELTDGSVVVGKLLSADGGKFKMETGFAGTIEIAQDQIKSLTTDEAVNVGIASGSSVLGKVQATSTGINVV